MALFDKKFSVLLLICVFLVAETFGTAFSNNNKTDFSFENSKESKILGGTPANIRDFPYQLSMFKNKTRIECGASIVTSKFALTSATCIVASWKPEWIFLSAGTHYRDGLSYVHQAKNFFDHPRINRYPEYYDIALIEVWQRFRWLPNVAPVKLPLAGFVVPKGAVAVLTGWGESESGEPSDVLRSAWLPMLSPEECLALDQFSTRVCGGTKLANGYIGDKGSPLVLDGVQLAVLDGSTNSGIGRFINLADENIHAWIFSNIY